jgi:two-component system NtrC family sensor kinase
VLQEGKIWTGPAFVVNDWYLSAYEPIRDVEDKVIGMLYVGILQQKFSDLKRNTLLLFLLTAVVGIGIALGAGYMLAVRISRPVSSLAFASRTLSRGDFSVAVEKTSEDEIGDLEETFNMMARSIRERDEKLKEETQQQLIQTEKLAAIGRLAAGVAHQINNPLTSVLTRTELLLRKAQEGQQKEDLEVVISEANRCSQIVKGLLDFSRQTIPRKEPFSLNQIVSDAVSLIRTQARFSNVEIVEDYAADLPSVVVDQSQLREVLLNIGLNALDAMPGGGSLRLSTSRSADRGSVRVTVEDTGAGIPQEHIPRLFDPFFTTKERGKGTGLGLAVSYGIVQAHAGSIEVESIAGKGSKFTIVLPLNASTAGSPASVSLAGGRVDGYGKGENPHSR